MPGPGVGQGRGGESATVESIRPIRVAAAGTASNATAWGDLGAFERRLDAARAAADGRSAAASRSNSHSNSPGSSALLAAVHSGAESAAGASAALPGPTVGGSSAPAAEAWARVPIEAAKAARPPAAHEAAHQVVQGSGPNAPPASARPYVEDEEEQEAAVRWGTPARAGPVQGRHQAGTPHPSYAPDGSYAPSPWSIASPAQAPPGSGAGGGVVSLLDLAEAGLY